jgi:hypothetical protein
MEVTANMLGAAVRKAVEIKLLPKRDEWLDDWCKVKAVLEAALAEADESADTIEQLTRERDAYLRMLTPENPGGLWYAATGRMDPFVVSWTAMELDGPWHDRNEAVAAVRRLAGLDAAPAERSDHDH